MAPRMLSVFAKNLLVSVCSQIASSRPTLSSYHCFWERGLFFWLAKAATRASDGVRSADAMRCGETLPNIKRKKGVDCGARLGQKVEVLSLVRLAVHSWVGACSLTSLSNLHVALLCSLCTISFCSLCTISFMAPATTSTG